MVRGMPHVKSVFATAGGSLFGNATSAQSSRGSLDIQLDPLSERDMPAGAWVTTLHVLPNGNIVIGNCHAGPDNPQLIEVTRDKKVVWTFKDFKQFGDATSNSQVLGVSGPVIR